MGTSPLYISVEYSSGSLYYGCIKFEFDDMSLCTKKADSERRQFSAYT